MSKKIKPKKEKEPKYYIAPLIEQEISKIIQNCNNVFTAFGVHDIKCLFKNVKEKTGKNVWIKILKEPITLLTDKKVLLIVGADWWNNNIDSEHTKRLIESLLSISVDLKTGQFFKRDYDIQTFSEIIKNPEQDFSKFSKVLFPEIIKKDSVKIQIKEDLKLINPE